MHSTKSRSKRIHNTQLDFTVASQDLNATLFQIQKDQKIILFFKLLETVSSQVLCVIFDLLLRG